MNNLNIVFIFDSGYIDKFVAVTRSILAHTSKKVLHFVLVFYGASSSLSLVESAIETYLPGISFDVVDIERQFPDISYKCKTLYITDNVEPHLKTPLLYIRMYLLDILPHLKGWLLHLDLDIIVRHDITKIIPKSNNFPIYAVLNKKFGAQGIDTVKIKRVISENSHLFQDYPVNIVNHVRDRELTPESSFNAGVWILNISKCKEYKLSTMGEICMVVNSIENAFPMCDQSILNFVFMDEVGTLDPKWNVKVGCNAMKKRNEQKMATIVKEAKIYHYAGAIKPWHAEFAKYCQTDKKRQVLQEWKTYAVNIQ